MLSKVWILYRFSSVEVDILFGENFDGHVVDGVHLSFQHDGIEEGIHAGIALLISMLGYQERDTPLTDTEA